MDCIQTIKNLQAKYKGCRSDCMDSQTGSSLLLSQIHVVMHTKVFA